MSRIPYASLDDFPPEIRERFSDNTANVTRMIANASPSVFAGFGMFAEGLLRHSPLPPALRELAILRVGFLSNCEYEVFQHQTFARHVGLSDREIAAITSNEQHGDTLSEAQSDVLRFVDDLVANVRPSDETLTAVRALLDDTQVTDLTLTVGFYMMVARFIEMSGVEIDENSIDWSGYPSA